MGRIKVISGQAPVGTAKQNDDIEWNMISKFVLLLVVANNGERDP